MSITRETGAPLECYSRWRLLEHDTQALLLVDFELIPWWLPSVEPPHARLPLTAIYCLGPHGLRVSVTDEKLETIDQLPVEQYKSWLDCYNLFSAAPGQPLGLAPVHIAKPWGQEIWFSGVEERGVCAFGDATARVSIPW